MAPIIVLLQTVIASISEVFLLCIAGYILARQSILDKKTQKQLNRLNVSLFTPSLLFSKVAFFLNPEKLRELWAIPIFFIFVTSVSMLVAYVLGIIFRLKRSQRSFAIAASMFMNSNSLPIALMQSLVVTVDGLQWGDDDTQSTMLGRALTYLVLYSTLGMMLRWSYGVHLLSQADQDPLSNDEVLENGTEDSPLLLPHGQILSPSIDPDEEHPTILRHNPLATSSIRDGSLNSDDNTLHPTNSSNRNSSVIQEENKSRKIDDSYFYSFPNTPVHSQVNLPVAQSSSSLDESAEDDDTNSALPRRRHTITPTSTRLQSFLRRTRHRTRKFIKGVNDFMTVPLWAALLSLVVALISPLQHILDEHSRPFKGALTAAGNCSIPLTLVVLGAYFYSPPENGKTERGFWISLLDGLRNAVKVLRQGSFSSNYMRTQGLSRPGETRTVAVAIISRMILTPILLLPLMVVAAKYDNPAVFDDPIFVVSNVLLISSPPALTLAQITQAATGDAFERLISRTIFWAYCVLTPLSTIVYVVMGLLISKL